MEQITMTDSDTTGEHDQDAKVHEDLGPASVTRRKIRPRSDTTDKQIEAMRPPPLWLCVLRPAVVPMITMIGTTFLLLWMEGKL